MIDPAHTFASWYLWIAAIAFAGVFAVPLMLTPLRWARVLGWRVDGADPLTRYFGRCLGALATAVVIGVARAAPSPAAHPAIFEIMIVATGLLAIVHIVGALEGQPWLETAEIALYGGLFVATTLIYRSVM